CVVLSCRQPHRAADGFFMYNESSGITSLDPAFAKNQSNIWAVYQLFNTLVTSDSNMQIVPSLAKAWEISDDRRSILFHLRTDVHFHDHPVFTGGKGRRMVADDVVFSFKRLMDPATASPGAWIFNGRVDTLQPFTAVNDSTFLLKLKAPFVQMLGVLSNVYCAIVPQEVLKALGTDFRRQPVGTGPFRFRTWEEGQTLLLLRNDHYFERDEAGQPLPYLRGVKVSFLDSKATEFLEFQQGRLHFVNDIDPSFKDEVLNKRGMLRTEWQNRVVLNKHPYLNIEYLGILLDSSLDRVKASPLKTRAVRKAINYGIDRRKMMLYLRNSIGVAAESGFVPMGLPSFNAATVPGYRYNPEQAKALLASAGFPGGKGLPPIKLITIPIYADIATYIVRQLEEIGISAQVEVVQKSLLLTQTAKSEALFFRASWIADYPDAENFFSVFYGKNPAPPNYTRYRNPVFDQYYEKATREPYDSIRYELYRAMDRMILEDAPIVPLWYDQIIHLVRPEVSGLRPNALNWLDVRRVRIGLQ
ncbi:MAG: ABC transporter substrate-binding protein, partial [Chitinophagaceae bacterium]